MDDVTKPGKTPASATSRPIIVGRGPAVQDPMVNNETLGISQDTPDKTEEKLAPPSAVKKVISPISPSADTELATEAVSKPTSDESKPADDTAAENNTDSAVVDAVLDQVSDKKKQEQLSAEEVKRKELIEKLVAEKKYFVPTKGPHQKRNNRIAILLLVVLLLGAGGVVAAVDARMLDIGITLPFDLIKQ